MIKKDGVTAFLLTPREPAKDEINNNTRDEYLLKIIDEIYSVNNIEVKTDLSIRQINAITKGQLFAKEYNCSIMDDLCDRIMILSVSKNRLGRKEFTEISKSIQTPYEDEMIPSLKTRLLGE